MNETRNLIARLNALAAQENCDGEPYDTMVEAADHLARLEAQLAEVTEALRNLLSRVANDADAHAWWCDEQEQAIKAISQQEQK